MAERHYSLKSQIAEVERELVQRAKVYPRLVSSRTLRQEQADLQVALMRSVLATLQWLEKNEAMIKAKVEA